VRRSEPRIEYELRDDIQVWLGADVFYDKTKGTCGEFDEADRIILGVEWGL
jgi:hypothetical protein